MQCVQPFFQRRPPSKQICFCHRLKRPVIGNVFESRFGKVCHTREANECQTAHVLEGSPEGLSQPGGAATGAPGAHDEPKAGEVGGVSALQAEFVILDVPQYVGPVMVAGHPTWVCIPRQTCRHDRFRSLARTNFPLVLCYGMTVSTQKSRINLHWSLRFQHGTRTNVVELFFAAGTTATT